MNDYYAAKRSDGMPAEETWVRDMWDAALEHKAVVNAKFATTIARTTIQAIKDRYLMEGNQYPLEWAAFEGIDVAEMRLALRELLREKLVWCKYELSGCYGKTRAGFEMAARLKAGQAVRSLAYTGPKLRAMSKFQRRVSRFLDWCEGMVAWLDATLASLTDAPDR